MAGVGEQAYSIYLCGNKADSSAVRPLLPWRKEVKRNTVGRSLTKNVGLIRRNWLWILVILGGIAIVAAFRFTRKTEAEYFTTKVDRGDIRQVIEATGTINPVTSVQVGSQVSGMISKLYVDFNSGD